MRGSIKASAGVLALWAALVAAARAGEDFGVPPGLPPTSLPGTQPCWPDPCHGSACDPCDRAKSACPDEWDSYLLPPRLAWYFVADGAAFNRDPEGDFRAASLGSPAIKALSTGDFNHDFQAAGRFLVGHTLNECLQIEGMYLGVTKKEDYGAVRNTSPNDLGEQGNLFSPFGAFGLLPVVGLDYNNFAEIRSTSSLTNVELNIRRRLPMVPERLAASILLGVRYMDMPEQLDYHTESDVPVPHDVTIRVNTANRMVGPQFGGMLELYTENRWWLNFEAKAALMSNRQAQATLYHNSLDPADVPTDRRETHTSFVGDLAVTFVYRWSPHFSTRLGYQAVWLDQVALAQNNLDIDVDILTQGPGRLNHDGRSVFHGPFAGIMVGW